MGKRQRAAIKYEGNPTVHVAPDGSIRIEPDAPLPSPDQSAPPPVLDAPAAPTETARPDDGA
jgi:hypothetical protein